MGGHIQLPVRSEGEISFRARAEISGEYLMTNKSIALATSVAAPL